MSEITTIGNLKFENIEYDEIDDRWQALFVSINDGQWHMAQPHYDTEDMFEIMEILKQKGLYIKN
jgi:hypothetical protein